MHGAAVRKKRHEPNYPLRKWPTRATALDVAPRATADQRFDQGTDSWAHSAWVNTRISSLRVS